MIQLCVLIPRLKNNIIVIRNINFQNICNFGKSRNVARIRGTWSNLLWTSETVQRAHAQVSSRLWHGGGHSGSGKCFWKSLFAGNVNATQRTTYTKRSSANRPTLRLLIRLHTTVRRPGGIKLCVLRTEPKRPPGIRYAFVRRAMRRWRGQNAYKVNRKRKFTSWRRTTSSECACIYHVCVCLGVYICVFVCMGGSTRAPFPVWFTDSSLNCDCIPFRQDCIAAAGPYTPSSPVVRWTEWARGDTCFVLGDRDWDDDDDDNVNGFARFSLTDLNSCCSCTHTYNTSAHFTTTAPGSLFETSVHRTVHQIVNCGGGVGTRMRWMSTTTTFGLIW